MPEPAPGRRRPTIASRSAAHPHSAGFDYLRIGLSVAVLTWHSFPISYGRDAVVPVVFGYRLQPFVGTILLLFFALSGFLVSGSLQRNSLAAFVSLRIVRIIPALAAEILLSALVLGPLLTVLALSAYFADGGLWAYFLNIVGVIHFTLPGVFPGNPTPDIVNGSLWTIPYELECYLVLVVVAVLGIFRRPWVFLALTLALTLVLTGKQILTPPSADTIVTGRQLVVAFLAGSLVYVFRERLPYANWAAALCAAAVYGLQLEHATAYFAAFPAAYLAAWLGLLDPPRNRLVASGDYSYGLYLFAFPIQQTAAQLIPYRAWWLNVAIALVFGLAYAALSWHLLEKRVLGAKSRVVRFANTASERVARRLPALPIPRGRGELDLPKG